ncbi:putative quinol monooxygenase [soil metagenome]
MVIIMGTVRIPPQNLILAREAMTAMVEASRADAGCISYGYAQDVFEPDLIRVSEVWKDQAAVDFHFATPHIAAWRATWASLGISDRRLSLYQAGDPKPL